MTTCDVLVVGAGPVGLFLTRELQRHGVSVMLVESKLQQSEHSKALAVLPRTLEVFEMAGMRAPFEAAANRVTQALIVVNDQTLTRIPLDGVDTRFPYVGMVPQDVTERILLEQLRAVGGDVRYGTQLTAFEQSAEGVRATLQTPPGGLQEVRAKYLVGCDGAHSLVRKLAQLAFEGSEYPEDFVLADLEVTGQMAADEMLLYPHPAGAFALFPLSATRCRLVAMAHPEGTQEVDLPFVNALLKARGVRKLEGTRVIWGSKFRIHHRQTARMQVGRVFLAGDAAHVHSPFGGQGMNTGLQDAWNLGWKLRAVLQGLESEALLETYSTERRPVVRAVVGLTDLMTRTMTARGSLARAVRNTAMKAALGNQRLRRVAAARLTQLGIGYPHSPRVPDETLPGGGTLYGLLGEHYVAVLPPGMERGELEGFGPRVRVVTGAGAHARLIRPDGYLGLDAGSGPGALGPLRDFLQRGATAPS